MATGNFAQTIRAKRQALGLTQAEFASMLTVSQQTVNNWECGRFEPWPRKRQILLEQLEIPSSGYAVKLFPEQRRKQPNVCEEIAGESAPDPGRQESVARPQIDFRRPPPHG